MYDIVFRGKAAKQVQKLSPPYFRQVQQAIDDLAQEPRPAGIIKMKNEPGYRLRVGVYRILYEIDDEQQVVTVYRVKHRREAYR